MKVCKPLRLGLITRPFELRGQCHLAVGVIAFASLDDGALLPEVDFWKLSAERLGEGACFDLGFPKSFAEFLVSGRAFSAGAPTAALRVRASLGPVDKTVLVVGDRRWERGAMTAPAPFTDMPLDWSRAFGGEGFALNPLGRGAAPGPDGSHALPNLELPEAPVRDPRDRPRPTGFGPVDFAWPQRASKAGTYDEAWIRDDMPGLARDIDWSIFNAAQDDQRLPDFPRGDEPFALEGMHPTRSVIRGRLPGLLARCFIQQRRGGELVTVEPPCRLDTVWFFPEDLRVALVYRTSLPIAEDDARDIEVLMAALERLDAPRPTEHYLEVLGRRLDKDRGYLHALRDDELLPAGSPLADGAPSDLDAMTSTEGALERNLRNGAQKRLDDLRANAAAQGIDPALIPTHLPPPMAPPTLANAAAMMDEVEKIAARAFADADAQQRDALETARKLLASQGIDLDEARAQQARGGPPRFRAEAQIAELRSQAARVRDLGLPSPELEAMLDDPAFAQRLDRLEAMLLDGYRLSVHHLPAAWPADAGFSAAMRPRVEATLAARLPFDRVDLTGVDLAGLQAEGGDLRGVLLERASLRDAMLKGAALSRAVLSRADLAGANLTNADLRDANLAHASLRGAWLVNVNLCDATLAGADLTGAILQGAAIQGGDLSGCVFSDTDLRGATLQGVTLLKTDLRGLRLMGSSLLKCTLVECDLRGVDLSSSVLSETVLVGCDLSGATLRGATLQGLRAVQGTRFTGCDLRGASLQKANLRGCALDDADLSDAQLDGADLSECSLRGARLDRARARGAMWARTDLTGASARDLDAMESLMPRAVLDGADLRGANLFRVDLLRARADKAVRLDGANLKRARALRRGP